MPAIPGIHHITAISGPPQQNVDFYTGVLRQRLVKKTVNFDAPDTYHLYYGDRTGRPGTILTFFPFVDAGPGRAGPGMASAYAYAVPKTGFDALIDDLDARGQFVPKLTERFGARVITLRDPDGAPVELVESDTATDTHAFHSVTLWLRDPTKTARLLTDVMGYEAKGSEKIDGTERLRLVAPGGAEASIVDLIRTDELAVPRPGAGTIHHVAFRAPTHDAQVEWQEKLASVGHRTTPIIDRNYFDAIYFREPGGVLFEIATDAPGFAADEPVETLGQALKLPPQHEPLRGQLERILPPITVRA